MRCDAMRWAGDVPTRAAAGSGSGSGELEGSCSLQRGKEGAWVRLSVSCMALVAKERAERCDRIIVARRKGLVGAGSSPVLDYAVGQNVDYAALTKEGGRGRF